MYLFFQSTNVGESLKLTRKLLSLGLSTVTYLRLDYPEECYQNAELDGLVFKILNPKNEKVANLCR